MYAFHFDTGTKPGPLILFFPSMTLNVSVCNEAKDLFLQTLAKERMHGNGYFWHIPPADSGETVRQ